MADEALTKVVTTVKANPLITAAVTTAVVGIAWCVFLAPTSLSFLLLTLL
jgi:hypothetical protein